MSATQQFTLSLNSSDEPLGLAMRRACDRCRKRKSRCDGQKICRSCLKVGACCSYLIAPKPLGRRPRKPRSKQLETPSQDAAAESLVQTAASDSSPEGSLGYVASANTQGATVPQTFPQDSPSLSGFATPYTLEEQSDMDLTASSDWSYPPLSLYSPSMDGGLPFDTSLGALTPANVAQQYFPLCTAPKIDPLGSLMTESPGSGPDWKLPRATFIPYIKLFFERLYPVFPVLDQESILTEDTPSDPQHASWDNYALLTSLAAAVTVQLNIVSTAGASPSRPHGWSSLEYSSIEKAQDTFSADFWVHQTLQARSQWDFMSDPSEATIMTSFFLFQYYGNRNQSQRAWYYLREAIGFAIAIGLDDQEAYDNLEPRTSQRRCRLFWLLFITERAYALQHRSSAMLRSSIDLPRIFESGNPKLIYGFVSLVNLFKSVDDKFLSLWKGGRASPGDSKHSWRRTFTAVLSDQNINSVCEIMEIQRLDIMVTQQWLHLLAWQMQTRKQYNELTNGIEAQKDALAANRTFPFTASRDTLQIVTKANRRSLESHGIGMEQKIFDIACCLSDTLQCSSRFDQNTISLGHRYLHGFMTLLSSFRNQESEYLQPLLAKASITIAAELSVAAALPSTRDFDEFIETWGEEVAGGVEEENTCELLTPAVGID